MLLKTFYAAMEELDDMQEREEIDMLPQYSGDWEICRVGHLATTDILRQIYPSTWYVVTHHVTPTDLRVFESPEKAITAFRKRKLW